MESESKPQRRVRIQQRRKPKPHWLVESLRHPLTILFIGTVITSMAVPWLNARSARARQGEEARQQKALEILKGAKDDNARLNIVRSAFQVFEKEGGLAGSAEAIEERRAELRKRVYDGYGEFEQSAWWWYWSIGREAELFGWLPTADIATFRSLAKEYQENLFQSSSLVQTPWKRYLSEVKETAADRKQAVMPALEGALGKKQAERDEIAAQMVRLFLK